MASSSYKLDPLDPRAPTVEQWDRMSAEEREHVVEQLPSKASRDMERETSRDELISRLDSMVTDLVAKEQELARDLEAAQANAERLAARLRALGETVDEE